MVDQFLT